MPRLERKYGDKKTTIPEGKKQYQLEYMREYRERKKEEGKLLVLQSEFFDRHVKNVRELCETKKTLAKNVRDLAEALFVIHQIHVILNNPDYSHTQKLEAIYNTPLSDALVVQLETTEEVK